MHAPHLPLSLPLSCPGAPANLLALRAVSRAAAMLRASGSGKAAVLCPSVRGGGMRAAVDGGFRAQSALLFVSSVDAAKLKEPSGGDAAALRCVRGCVEAWLCGMQGRVSSMDAVKLKEPSGGGVDAWMRRRVDAWGVWTCGSVDGRVRRRMLGPKVVGCEQTCEQTYEHSCCDTRRGEILCGRQMITDGPCNI
eukprot:352615-Chlamydomonas_euryale.AAC.1